MAAPMWRMNGLWMAGVLVLCALLLSNEVMCQDGTTDAPAADPSTNAADAADPSAVTDAADAAAASGATAAPDAGADPSVAAGVDLTTVAPGNVPFVATILNPVFNPDNQDDGTSGTSGTTAGPVVVKDEVTVPAEVVVKIVPGVKCVGQNDISESNAIRVELETDDCETTKRIIEENPAAWCKSQACDLKIFQNGKTLLMASDQADFNTLASALQSEDLKEKLGVTKTVTPPSSGSSVFVGILVSGLLAALAITVGYFKCQRRSDTKGVRLAEEAYPVDQENQGNTLVSVAPLNPPAETPEKPSVNGESPEVAKTQPPPPTNGHSTTNTADTEM